MITTLEQVKAILDALPLDVRAELALYLLHSLEPDDAEEVEWVALAEARLAAIHSGQVIGIAAEDVLKRLPSKRV